MIYERVRSIDGHHARVASRLAAPLLAGTELEWHAVGDTPYYCQPASKDATCNESDHLAESEAPEMLTLREASLMAAVGLQIIVSAIPGMERALARPPRARLAAVQAYDRPGVSCDVAALKAGAQLVVDAFLADEKCQKLRAEDVMVMKVARGPFDEHRDFMLTSALFDYIVYRALGKLESSFLESAAAMRDYAIRQLEDKDAPNDSARFAARLYFVRSFDKLRAGDALRAYQNSKAAPFRGPSRLASSKIEPRSSIYTSRVDPTR